jgi:hypothetical protein
MLSFGNDDANSKVPHKYYSFQFYFQNVLITILLKGMESLKVSLRPSAMETCKCSSLLQYNIVHFSIKKIKIRHWLKLLQKIIYINDFKCITYKNIHHGICMIFYMLIFFHKYFIKLYIVWFFKILYILYVGKREYNEFGEHGQHGPQQ